MKNFLLIFLLATTPLFIFAQCPTGTTVITGNGCGCLSGCDLTALGGPNCSPAVSGGCTPQTMTATINVPAGCTYTVTALIANRGSNCSASGADGSDFMKVDVLGGNKPDIYGGGNGYAEDSYTLTGPGTIVCTGTVNRADEIMTYTTTSSNCVDCMSSLPIELTDFQAYQEQDAVACIWTTETELDNDFFTIERSADGIHFDVLGYVKGAGNSTQQLSYKLYDTDPFLGITSYYRLSQTDYNGISRQVSTRSIKSTKIDHISIFPNPSSGNITIQGDEHVLNTVQLIDVAGRIISTGEPDFKSNSITFTNLSEGIYTVSYFDNQQVQTQKVIVAY